MSEKIYKPLGLDAGVVVTLLGVTAGVWFLLQPTLSRSVDESRAQSSLVKERRSASEQSRTLAVVQTDLRVTRRELDGYTQSCWSDVDRSRRIEKLYTLAHTCGVTVDNLEPGDSEMVSGRRGLTLRMVARAPFKALPGMLHGLRNENPDMVLRSVELGPTPNSDEELTATVEILWVLPAETVSKDAPTPPVASGTR